MSGYCTASCRY